MGGAYFCGWWTGARCCYTLNGGERVEESAEWHCRVCIGCGCDGVYFGRHLSVAVFRYA